MKKKQKSGDFCNMCGVVYSHNNSFSFILVRDGCTSIVGVAKKNKYQVVSSGNSRHDFYAWENKILFLKLRKFRIPKQTRFKTLVLLLQPSMKPFDHGTSMELRISSDQLR